MAGLEAVWEGCVGVGETWVEAAGMGTGVVGVGGRVGSNTGSNRMFGGVFREKIHLTHSSFGFSCFVGGGARLHVGTAETLLRGLDADAV